MEAKRPISILAVVHTPQMQVLLLERVRPSQFWQSVTGSQEFGESLAETASREIEEETGIRIAASALIDLDLANRFPIPPAWRARYGPCITHNVEHVFSACLASPCLPKIDPNEHQAWQWLRWENAAQRVWSWTNRDAIRLIAQRTLAPD